MLVEMVVSWSHIEKWVACGWDRWGGGGGGRAGGGGVVAVGSRRDMVRRLVEELFGGGLSWRFIICCGGMRLRVVNKLRGGE